MSETRTLDLAGPSEDAALRGLRKRTVVASGIGFFTDAYDLFVIGIVSTLLKGQWHLGAGQLALLNAVMLGAAFLNLPWSSAGSPTPWPLRPGVLDLRRAHGARGDRLRAVPVAACAYRLPLPARLRRRRRLPGQQRHRRRCAPRTTRGEPGRPRLLRPGGRPDRPAALLASPSSAAASTPRSPGGCCSVSAPSPRPSRSGCGAGCPESDRFTAAIRGYQVGRHGALPTKYAGTRGKARPAAELQVFLANRRLLTVLTCGTAGCWFLLDCAYYGNSDLHAADHLPHRPRRIAADHDRDPAGHLRGRPRSPATSSRSPGWTASATASSSSSASS